jgi:hypothetical protein
MAASNVNQPESEGPPADTSAASPGEPAGEEAAPDTEVAPEQAEQAALLAASLRHPFGPAFFMTQLRGFAGEKCPDPEQERPVVEIHLRDGETLDLCHIIGVTPGWVALAVLDGEGETSAKRIRTEFVPFEAIARVTLRGSRPKAPHLGFEHSRVPQVLTQTHPEMSPEAAIRAAAAGGPGEPTGD